VLVRRLVEYEPCADKGDQSGHPTDELSRQSTAAVLIRTEAEDLSVSPDREGGHLHHRGASLTSFPGFKGAIIIKGIKQVFGGFTSHGRQGMGPEKKESHLGEDLLTVGEE
jgi:hypothetical protein